MAAFLVVYMNESYCGSSLESHLQTKLAKVLWKMSYGFLANTNPSECKLQDGSLLGEMTEQFCKRCVDTVGKTRMGILDYWLHQKAGLAARAAACRDGHRCGLKLTDGQNALKYNIRCQFCKGNRGGVVDNDDDGADDDDDDDDDGCDADDDDNDCDDGHDGGSGGGLGGAMHRPELPPCT